MLVQAAFLLGICGGNSPKSLKFPPKKVSELCKTISLRLLLQVYRCSSEWKTTSLYCNMYFCEYSNVAHGIKVTVQHQEVAA